MQSRTNLFIMFFVVSFLSIGFAQQAKAAETDEDLSFPYIAQITGDDVYIRSGPGTQYYRCGKLNKTNRVKVVGSQFSWSRIVPPKGSFSWISKQYVNIDAENSTIGTVTGDAVRVYAGSPDYKPIHSTTLQLKFNKGDKVRLLGEEKGDYYKIAPPTSAYLWVSTRYTHPLGQVDQDTIKTAQTEIPKTEITEKVITEVDEIVVTPAPIVSDGQFLKQYYQLEKQIKEERKKPFDKQNYGQFKKELAAVANNKQAGKAARYAQFAIKQIESLELALAVSKDLRLQDEKLRKVKEGIEKTSKAKMAKIPDLGKFAVIGKLQTSILYASDSKLPHYRIIDDAGKTLCYAVAAKDAKKLDLSGYVGTKVGLIGKIEPHIETKGAMVEFTKITELP